MISALTLLFCTVQAVPSELTPLLTRFQAELVQITPGTPPYPASFWMGGAPDGPTTEQPRHSVTLSHPFAISRYEVTQELWEAVMGANPSRWPGPRNAVERVSFDEAQEFCQKLTGHLRQAGYLSEKQEVRLPTEAEWEYAVRAGSQTRYSFGDDATSLDKYAWHTGNAAGNDPPVGAKLPNPWGLYDMHGYVWEWCLDNEHPNYAAAPSDGRAWLDPTGPDRRIVRGGSWKDPADKLTSSFRQAVAADARDDAIGFRCVVAEVAQ